MKLQGLEPEWLELNGAKFKLRPLTPAERLECLSYGSLHEVCTMYDKACHYGLIGWEGVEDENGAPVGFDSALISRLPDKTWAGIARHVLNLNELQESDQKNS